MALHQGSFDCFLNCLRNFSQNPLYSNNFLRPVVLDMHPPDHEPHATMNPHRIPSNPPHLAAQYDKAATLLYQAECREGIRDLRVDVTIRPREKTPDYCWGGKCRSKKTRTIVAGVLTSSFRASLGALCGRARFLCFYQRPILCVEFHPVLRTPLRFGKFCLGKCYKRYSGWSDLAVVRKFGRALITRAGYWFASTPVTLMSSMTSRAFSSSPHRTRSNK